MQVLGRLTLVVTAAAALTVAVGSASARRIEVSNQRFLAIWTSLNFSGGFGETILCPITLEGSFHSKTTSKVSGELAGNVTEAVVDNAACINGHATVLRENLPWHIQYNSFTGTLPNIATIKFGIIGSRFRIETAGFSCLGTMTQARPTFGTVGVTGGTAGTLTAEGAVSCGISSGTFEGAGEVFVQHSTTTRLTVRLVQ